VQIYGNTQSKNNIGQYVKAQNQMQQNQMNGRRVSMMQGTDSEKKAQQFQGANPGGGGGGNEPPASVVNTIKSSEFNKFDQTRS
jgi:hypothetical protein